MPNPLRAEAVVFIPSASVPEVQTIEHVATVKSQRLTSRRRKPNIGCQTNVKDTPSENIGLMHQVNTPTAKIGNRRRTPHDIDAEISTLNDPASSKEKRSNLKKGNSEHRRGDQKMQQTCRCNRSELVVEGIYIGTATKEASCNSSSSTTEKNQIDVGKNQECRNDVFNKSIRVSRSISCRVCG